MSDLLSITEPVIEPLNDPWLRKSNIKLDLLRLDTIHPLVNGNKWFKLKLNVQSALNAHHHAILSFGGAYSNHLRALAAASSILNIKSIGVVRGERTLPLNPVLQFAQEKGMQLHFVSRADYRLKHTPDFIEALRSQFGDFYLIPEGGSNELGVKGCEGIIDCLDHRVGAEVEEGKCYLAVACGTGATLAGLIRGVARKGLRIHVLGVAVLKGAGFLEREVSSWLPGDQLEAAIPKWQIELDYHCGGYAKQNPALVSFIERFERVNQVSIEPVYTGKLFAGIYDLIEKGTIPAGSKVIATHTGGVYK
jgi:1-aminocyclopropane-1-carboxylate deaminase